MKTNISKLLILIAISSICFLINVDYSALSLALLPISQQFQTNISITDWILGAYVLAWAICVIPAGIYSEKFQKRNVFIFGLILFFLASLGASLAQSAMQLIFIRALQGIGGAIITPMMYALIYLNFSNNERGKAMGIISLGVGLGLAAGPALGGFFLEFFSWRAIFLINLPIVIFAILTIYYLTTHEKLSVEKIYVNKFNMAFLAFWILSLILILNPAHFFPTYIKLTFLLFLTISLGIFLPTQNKANHPVIPLRLFANLPFSVCCIGMFFDQICFSTLMIMLAFYLEKNLHFSWLNSGLFYLAFTLCFALIATFGGSWVDKVGLKKPISLGFFIMALGNIFFLFLGLHASSGFLLLTFILLGSGMGLAFVGINSGVIKVIPEKDIAVGTSVFMLISLVGNCMGVTLASFNIVFSHIISFIILICAAMTLLVLGLLKTPDAMPAKA